MGCRTRKVEYIDERDAWWGAYFLYLRDGFDQSPYLCECGMWHLSSKQGEVPEWLQEIMRNNQNPK